MAIEIGNARVPLIGAPSSDNPVTTCPVCGMGVRFVVDSDGNPRHYEAIATGEEWNGILAEEDPFVAEQLRRERKGKKTVAVVGMATTSCSLAPYSEPSEDVEIWSLNEAHAFDWMKRADRWFQIHDHASWHRYVAKRDVRGHLDWLKENPWDIPIYMQYENEEVSRSVRYPLHKVTDLAFANFRRGTDKVKYFTSTLAYMLGVCALEGVQRVEIYGFELADELEYVQQKACAEWWIGFLMGRGVEIYTPKNCQILYSKLYGGSEQGAGW